MREESPLGSIVPFLHTLERTPLAVAIAESAWAFPIAETVHVVALTIMIGTILVMDLRLLGIASAQQNYKALRRDVLPWTWLAFCGAVISGSLMVITRAAGYFGNDAFRIKLILLVLAGINMLVFELIIARGAPNWDRGSSVPWAGKIAALLSLALWISIVFFGRWVGFTMILEN
jgi:hypothetical protein